MSPDATSMTYVEVWSVAGIIGGLLVAAITLLFSIHVNIMKKVREEAGDSRETNRSLLDHQERIVALEKQTSHLSEMQSDMKNLRDDFHHMRMRLDKVIDLYIASQSSKNQVRP